ncbi:hypothetical protein SUGI_1095650 [Cryptomeria japonica]|nr:hypothetical protein SUGI_1095650 [Cryptomeria japonica]
MVKIHGLPFSTCTTRVLACCHEKEVEYEVIPVNLMAGAHKQKPHLDLNPFGQIPALQDGDLTLFESRAITRYLSKKQQGKGTELLGGRVTEQAIVDVWCEVEAHQFSAPSSAVVFQTVILPLKGGKTDEKIVKSNVEKLSRKGELITSRPHVNAWWERISARPAWQKVAQNIKI